MFLLLLLNHVVEQQNQDDVVVEQRLGQVGHLVLVLFHDFVTQKIFVFVVFEPLSELLVERKKRLLLRQNHDYDVLDVSHIFVK